jgi:hypothetical protein
LKKPQATLKQLFSPAIVARSLRISLVVGTLLVLINQLDALVAGTMNGILAGKILLTYMVPYAVSSYSSYCALRDAGGDDGQKPAA